MKYVGNYLYFESSNKKNSNLSLKITVLFFKIFPLMIYSLFMCSNTSTASPGDKNSYPWNFLLIYRNKKKSLGAKLGLLGGMTNIHNILFIYWISTVFKRSYFVCVRNALTYTYLDTESWKVLKNMSTGNSRDIISSMRYKHGKTTCLENREEFKNSEHT